MRAIKLSVYILGAISVSGCVPLVLGGATETAVVAAQERSVGNAIDDAAIVIKIKNLYAQQD